MNYNCPNDEEAPSQPVVIYNDVHIKSSLLDRSKCDSTFPRFQEMPAEIRHMVWQYAFPFRQRLIGINIIEAAGVSRERPNEQSQRPYRVYVTTSHRPPALLSISSETRRLALRFYRVDSAIDSPDGRRISRRLYTNPNTDCFHVKCGDEAYRLFANFCHDYMQSDLYHVGIQNIAIGDSRDIRIPMPRDANEFAALDPVVLGSFKSTITNLKNVYFHVLTNHDLQRMGCCRPRVRSPWGVWCRYRRTFPIEASAEPFEILDRDPREIDLDLARIALGDPRFKFHEWCYMERTLQIDRAQHRPNLQYMFAAETRFNKPPIFTRDEALEWLASLEESERQLREKHHLPYPGAASPLPAFGFWLFPMEALGMPVDRAGQLLIDHPSNYREERGSDYVWDLTKHRPRLGILHLP